MKKPEVVRYVQDSADAIRRATGASYTVVLVVGGDEMYVGAQVPRLEVLAVILRRALEQLEDGSADVTDFRKS